MESFVQDALKMAEKDTSLKGAGGRAADLDLTGDREKYRFLVPLCDKVLKSFEFIANNRCISYSEILRKIYGAETDKDVEDEARTLTYALNTAWEQGFLEIYHGYNPQDDGVITRKDGVWIKKGTHQDIYYRIKKDELTEFKEVLKDITKIDEMSRIKLY